MVLNTVLPQVYGIGLLEENMKCVLPRPDFVSICYREDIESYMYEESDTINTMACITRRGEMALK